MLYCHFIYQQASEDFLAAIAFCLCLPIFYMYSLLSACCESAFSCVVAIICFSCFQSVISATLKALFCCSFAAEKDFYL